MASSVRITSEDIRAVFRLLGEVRELGEDTPAWEQHLLRGAARLTEAMLGFSGATVGLGGNCPRPVGLASIGWDCPSQRASYQAAKARRPKDTSPFRLFMLPRRFEVFTTDDAAMARAGWWSAEDAGAFRCAGVGSFLFSGCPIGADAVHSITLMRPAGERRFGTRHAAVVQLLHEELGRLLRRGAESAAAADPAARLPRRLGQTLACLRRGASEKQVAGHLGLSQHTVHDYVKALHKRFGASSLGELLAATTPPRPRYLPVLDPALLRERDNTGVRRDGRPDSTG